MRSLPLENSMANFFKGKKKSDLPLQKSTFLAPNSLNLKGEEKIVNSQITTPGANGEIFQREKNLTHRFKSQHFWHHRPLHMSTAKTAHFLWFLSSHTKYNYSKFLKTLIKLLISLFPAFMSFSYLHVFFLVENIFVIIF